MFPDAFYGIFTNKIAPEILHMASLYALEFTGILDELYSPSIATGNYATTLLPIDPSLTPSSQHLSLPPGPLRKRRRLHLQHFSQIEFLSNNTQLQPKKALNLLEITI